MIFSPFIFWYSIKRATSRNDSLTAGERTAGQTKHQERHQSRPHGYSLDAGSVPESANKREEDTHVYCSGINRAQSGGEREREIGASA